METQTKTNVLSTLGVVALFIASSLTTFTLSGDVITGIGTFSSDMANSLVGMLSTILPAIVPLLIGLIAYHFTKSLSNKR